MKRHHKTKAALERLGRKLFGDPEQRLINRAQATYDWFTSLPLDSPRRAEGIKQLHQLQIKLETMCQNDRSHGYRAASQPLICKIDKLMPIPNRP